MEKHILIASKRSLQGRKVKQLRAVGFMPANIYGKKTDPTAIQLNTKEFVSLYAKVGETGLIDLQVDGTSHPVLVHGVQYDPVKGTIVHIDFYQVNLKEKVTAYVPLEISGEAPAEKDKIGQLLTQLTEVEVEALPAELPEKIMVDVSGLAQVDDGIKVSDLKSPTGVTILTPGDQDVVKVAELIVKEEEPTPVEEASASEGEAGEPATEASSGETQETEG